MVGPFRALPRNTSNNLQTFPGIFEKKPDEENCGLIVEACVISKVLKDGLGLVKRIRNSSSKHR